MENGSGAPGAPFFVRFRRSALHPSIHIAVAVVVAGGCSSGRWPDIALGMTVVAIGLMTLRAPDWGALRRGIRRLRFLLLSIVVLYGWFQPGVPLVPMLGDWSPTLAGMSEGGLRAAALVVMVATVHWLMRYQGEAALLAGLMVLLEPLRRLRLPSQRIALRLMLALRLVPELRVEVEDLASRAHGGGRWWQRAALAGDVFVATVARADRTTAEVVDLPTVERPRWWAWSLPWLLAFGFWWLT